MRILTLIPLRPDGVRGTMEFIFSVHPSSTLKASEAATPQKKGANITQEAMAVVTRIITSPPLDVSPEEWFSKVAPQLIVLLDGSEGPELSTAAAQIIMFGILGRKQFGAPGNKMVIGMPEAMLTFTQGLRVGMYSSSRYYAIWTHLGRSPVHQPATKQINLTSWTSVTKPYWSRRKTSTSPSGVCPR